jgi:hypothetical protein
MRPEFIRQDLNFGPRALFVALAAWILAAGGASPAGTPAPNEEPGNRSNASRAAEYPCRRIGGAITVDGRIDEAAWADAETITLRRTDSGLAANVKTEAKMLWDSNALYVAWMCDDADIWTTMSTNDSNLWEEEVVEIFIDPDGDGKDYLELEINPTNAVVDIKIMTLDPWKSDVAWGIPGLATAVRVEGTLNRHSDTDTRWTVEAAIPWAGMAGIEGATGEAPTEGAVWRANLYRIERFTVSDPDDDEYLAWAPTGQNFFHIPDAFGLLRFQKAVLRSPDRKDMPLNLRGGK